MRRVRKIKKKNNLLIGLLVAVVIFALIIGGFNLYNWYFQDYSIPSVDKLIEEKKEINYSDKDDHELDTSNYINKLPEYRSKYNNQNIMGRLEIPGLNIDTLVTQAGDNKFYLDYDLYNRYDGFGVPFFDYRNSNLGSDRQINIYGHNTEYKQYYYRLPLTNLEAYMNKDMFDNYKNIYLSIDEKQVEYETVAVKIVTAADPEHMKIAFYGDQDFISHSYKLFNNIVYKNKDLTITTDDRLLVLQICHYNPKNSYLLVIGKEV